MYLKRPKRCFFFLPHLANLKITTAPNNIQVSEGSTALLPCVVSGDNVNIGWSRYCLSLPFHI